MGRPSRAFVAVADDEAVDNVVVGSRGRTGQSRVLLGS
jgi:nucleotide-binding universal stress UspA family protein